jgi:hypothetical protein
MNLLIFYLLVLRNVYYCESNIRINEIYIKDSALLSSEYFIELKSIGEPRRVKLENYKLLGITFDTIFQRPTLDLVINLNEYYTNDNGLFTAGGPNVGLADLRAGYVAHEKYIKANERNSYIRSYNLDKDYVPYAILLVLDSSNDINFNEDYSEITNYSPSLLEMDNRLKSIIKESLKDLVIFRSEIDGVRKWNYYEDLFEPFRDQPYVLKGYSNLKSLSRCDIRSETEIQNFKPHLFKESEPTPNSENDCKNTKFLIIEIPISLSLERMVETNFDEMIDEDVIDENICTKDLMDDVHEDLKYQFFLDQNSETQTLSFDSSNFQESWIPLIEANQNDLLSITTITNKDIKPWFEYLYNEENPRKSTYRCRICFRHSSRIYPDIYHTPLMARAEGRLSTSLRKNGGILRNHAKSKIHNDIIKHLKSAKMTEYYEERQLEIDANLTHKLAATSRMMRVVYVEILADVPFNQHKLMVQAQTIHGVDMGSHHNNQKGATRMTQVISETMHIDLLNEMKETHPIVSLLVDGATDNTGNHFIICLFHFHRNGIPNTSLYKLLQIGVSEKAEDLFNLIISAFVKDGIDIYMKTQLLSFVSDGASVLSGKRNSVYTKLQNWILPKSRRLVRIHCCPHKLQLALTHSYKKFSFVGEIELILKELSTFYYGPSHKRKIHLEKFSIETNRKAYRFSSIFESRWIASEYQAVRRLINSYDLVVEDLNSIKVSVDDFNKGTRDKDFWTSIKLLERLKGKNFVHSLHFVADVLRVVSQTSLQLQNRDNLIASINPIMEKLVELLESLKTVNGPYLTEFFQSCTYVGGNYLCENVQAIEEREISYKNIDLIDDVSEVMWNSTSIRGEFIDKIIEEINDYFPTEDFKSFQVFEPSLMPIDPSKVPGYATVDINRICDIFGLESKYDVIVEQFKGLLYQIIYSEFNHKRCMYFGDFWTIQLRSLDITWDVLIKQIVDSILTIPIGATSCERGFSVMSYIKDKKRSNLKPVMLEHLLRVRINGPKSLEKFDAAYYAGEWSEQGILSDDNRARGNDN